MLATKPGNGGHGLEVYNIEDGKYAQVTCSFNGQDINGWEEYRDAILASNPQWKTAYDSDSNIAQQFDTMVQDQMYPELLQNEVNRLNTEGESQIKFDSPEDAALNMHKLFGAKLVDNLLANDILHNEMVSVNPYKPDYKVSVLAACIQMNRYAGNNRMNPITQSDFDNRSQNFPSVSLYWGSSSDDLRRYLSNATEIPVIRNMGISSETVWREVKRSFWDPNSQINSTLSRVGGKNCSHYGSVCYMSTGGYEYDEGAPHTIKGIVKLDGVKYTFCPSPNRGADVDAFRGMFNRNKQTIINNLVGKLTEGGKMSSVEARQICASLENQIANDCGLCAMIMGYDAIAGAGYQFDIINPNIVDVVYD